MAEKNTSSESPETPENPALKELADKYLDFWQQNLTIWATDPKALERWVETLSAGQTKSPDKDSPTPDE